MAVLKKAYSFSSLNFSAGAEETVKKYDLIKSIKDLPAEPKAGEVAMVQFHMFRTGEWEHPWYGPIIFDEAYIDNLIANFKAGVVPREISFDIDHSPNSLSGSTKAYGWMKDLTKVRDTIDTPMGKKEVVFLDVVAELNSAGILAIKDKEYSYCSAEIDGDYTTFEKHTVETDEGEEASTVLTHGPTVTGCAFTNRPFIPNLDPVAQFSEENGENLVEREIALSDADPTGIQFFSYRDVKKSVNHYSRPAPEQEEVPEEVGQEEETKSNEEPQPAQEAGGQEPEIDTGVVEMKFAELLEKMKKATTLADQIAVLQEGRAKFDGNELITIDSLIEAKEAQKADADTVQEYAQRRLQTQEASKAQADELARLKVQLAEAREGEWSQRVKAYAADLREAGHHETLVKTVEAKLSAFTATARKQKFSMLKTDGEGTEEQGVLELLSECFAAIPESARLNTGEELEANLETEVSPDAGVDVEEEPEEETPEEKTGDRELAIKAYSRRHGVEPDEDMIPFIDEATGAVDVTAMMAAARK